MAVNKEIISNKIAVIKTDKRLLEFEDKLHTAPSWLYAHLHANGEEGEDGEKKYSNIGVLIQDYSLGTGENIKKATANLKPWECFYIFNKINSGTTEFLYTTDKIFGVPDKEGYSKVVKIKIERREKMPNGVPARIPWQVQINNGKGIADKVKTGGTMCRSGSFISEQLLFMSVSDEEMYRLFYSVTSFITQWENAHCPALIRLAKKTVEEKKSGGGNYYEQ